MMDGLDVQLWEQVKEAAASLGFKVEITGPGGIRLVSINGKNYGKFQSVLELDSFLHGYEVGKSEGRLDHQLCQS